MYINKFFKCIAIVTLLATAIAPVSALTKQQKKRAKEEYKNKRKEGWKTKPGIDLLSQLETVQEVIDERDDSGYPVWITADASSKTTVYNAGKSSAILLAKNNLGLLIETELGDDIAAAVINEDQGELSYGAIEKVKQKIKGHMSNTISNTWTIMDCYKPLDGGRMEVLVRIAIKRSDAIKQGVKVFREFEKEDDL